MNEFALDIPERDRVPAGKLNVCRQGAGQTLILLHGFPLSSRMWANQLTGLTDRFDVVVPDLRGFGNSSPLPENWSVAEFARDVDSMMQLLELQESIVCGLSLGGYIAFELLAQAGDRISALALCNTRATADDEVAARGRRLMAERVSREGAGFVKEVMLAKLLAPQNLGKPLSTEMSHFFETAHPESIAITQLAMSQRGDFTRQLPKINCPTLVIAGDHDAITPATAMKELCSQIPCATFELIRGAGHLTPIENPKAFNQAIIRAFANGQ